jgi:hypothetical protein
MACSAAATARLLICSKQYKHGSSSKTTIDDSLAARAGAQKRAAAAEAAQWLQTLRVAAAAAKLPCDYNNFLLTSSSCFSLTKVLSVARIEDQAPLHVLGTVKTLETLELCTPFTSLSEISIASPDDYRAGWQWH